MQTQYDYRPWQRTTGPRVVSTGNPKIPRNVKSPCGKPGNESRPVSGTSVHTACSSKCQHIWNKKCVIPPINAEEEKRRHKRLADLKMQIKSKEQSLCQYRKLYDKLLEENDKNRQEISNSEEQNHLEAKSLLLQHQRYRGSISTLQKQYKLQSSEYYENYKKNLEKVSKEVHDLQVQTKELDTVVVAKHNEVKTLSNYKEKEYPGKVQTIAQLKRIRERLRIAHENELEELAVAINEDRAKRQAREKYLENKMRAYVTEETIQSMSEDVKEVALQNLIMKKEIEIHKDEVRILKNDISKLQAEIIEISDKTPDAHLPRISTIKKCLPNDDVELDIPLQTWLPI